MIGEKQDILDSKINQLWSPEHLADGEAVTLAHTDTLGAPGSIKRAKGYVRGDFTTGLSQSVIRAGLFVTRAGTEILIYQDSGGNLKSQIKPLPQDVDGDY